MTSVKKSENPDGHLTGSEHARVDVAGARRLIMDSETRLWSSAARRDGERLEWMLHHDFTGVTREGERVTREDLIDATFQTGPCGGRDFSGWHFHMLPWPLVLATYTLTDGCGESRHMSIWDISTGLARLRFHQGTWASVLQAS